MGALFVWPFFFFCNQQILDNQIIQNQHKITLALQKRKKEEEAWRIFNIKNQYAIKEANDVLSIISAKDDEETYKAKVQLAKDEMTEKVKILDKKPMTDAEKHQRTQIHNEKRRKRYAENQKQSSSEEEST